jgi:endonuclease/exonuclease/phosphatase family metal-dependent hydrolase
MARQSTPLYATLLRSYPASAGLLVILTSVLGWLGCDSLSRVADQTAAVLQTVPGANVGFNSNPAAPWGSQVPGQSPFGQNAGYQTPYPSANPAGYPSSYPTGYGQTPQGQYPPAPYGQYPATPQPQVQYAPQTQQQPTYTNANAITPASQAQYITIGSFNIQVFGADKIGNSAVMSYLVDVARKFDVLAIQELRSTDDSIIPRFVQMINQPGTTYGYLVGPREGRTNSKEQYVILFNEQKVERVDQGAVIRHPQGYLHRDPIAATFRCRGVDPRAAFTFTLLNIHTDPDEVPQEMAALADVWQLARRTVSYEDDLILLGDFNASPAQFGPLARVPNLYALVPPEMNTNTARTKCYDNIVFDRTATTEYLGKYGVFDFADFYKIDRTQAAQISDHLPVWGVFSVYEQAPPNLAAQPAGFRF